MAKIVSGNVAGTGKGRQAGGGDPVNRLGLTARDYEGEKSTLCPGCGHEIATKQIVRALWEMSVEPYRIVKISGIGCSSRTPSFFAGRAHGFNGIHGRMPGLATGIAAANRELLPIGISGDGDTAAIGIGQFIHLIRRNVRMIYVMEDNGVYSLTKGQFSPTADIGSTLKDGSINDQEPVDCCSLAILLGCPYVARSFSGDPVQLLALLKGAIAHNGMAFVHVLSPCVTFNDHEGSTKSYKRIREAACPVHRIEFVPAEVAAKEPDRARRDGRDGTPRELHLADGSFFRLDPLEEGYDPGDRARALERIAAAARDGRLLTGLLYYEPNRLDMNRMLNLVEEPLANLPPGKTRPGREVLDEIMQTFK
ncbi:MAG: 2-oxoacid:ferredoxin oxidoreductase subunit beta [Planctomycetota bacterium]|nr:2-oxoacid:ferredoxin oxidoreductase subunit beta [Planctomycetota bacterium]